MRIALVCLAATGFCQAQPEKTLIVCMENFGKTYQARSVTSRIYATIGVRIDWRMQLRGCPEQGIRIRFSTDTPASDRPGALAYATPFGEAVIVVFYDRLTDTGLYRERVFNRLLGHVLAHEIGHVLERIDRHSASGVMKARWKGLDFVDIVGPGLRFEKVDVDLILAGVAARAKDSVVTAGLK